MAPTLPLVAAISGVYDLAVGLVLLAAPDQVAAWFGAPAPVPPIQAELNGLFLIVVGVGYWLPYRDPVRYRGYLWVMGPGLKGAGAALFVIDGLRRASPASFLLFALSDGLLAALTLWALLTFPPPSSGGAAARGSTPERPRR